MNVSCGETTYEIFAVWSAKDAAVPPDGKLEWLTLMAVSASRGDVTLILSVRSVVELTTPAAPQTPSASQSVML